MEIKREIIVDKNIQDVWEVLGNQYTEAYKWAGGLYHSEGFGAPVLEGASCSSRACDTSFGQLREEIRTFDAKNFRLEYEVVEGFPGFVKNGTNRWQLTQMDHQQTKVTMRFTASTPGLIGAVMGTMMKLQLGKGLSSALSEFKHYVETGQPHPNKVKDMEKHAKKQRRLATT